VFAALVLPPLLLLAVVSFMLEPLRGDLTRIGGYSENEYGWNSSQSHFAPPLVTSDRYDRPYDIVVLGDSFSVDPYGTGQTEPGVYWPNHLAQRSGLSVLSLTLFKFSLPHILDNRHFGENPPRLVVLQVVESMLGTYFDEDARGYLGASEGPCAVAAPSPHFDASVVRMRHATTRAWLRDTQTEFSFDQAVQFLWKAGLRAASGETGAHDLQLTRSDLFSSRRPDRLLVHDRDFRKAGWTEATIRKFRCNLIEAQNRIQANGVTRFALMVVPDKLTIYADYLVEPALAPASRLDTVFEGTGLNMVALLTPLRTALRCGEVDLYLPNDTHWNTTGHAIAADAVLRSVGFETRAAGSAMPPRQC
jgi:hypothetical protein